VAGCAAGARVGAGTSSRAGAGAGGASSGRALPAPSISSRISSLPTAMTSPTLPPSATTLPTTGDGISTVALSVMTPASGWSSATVSPTCTCQPTSSTSAIPSPMSGILMIWIPMSCLHHALERRAHTGRPREVSPFLRVRIGGIPSRHTLDGRLQVMEAVLLHQRDQFGPEAAGAGGLVHHHATSGLAHRIHDGVQVQRPQAAQVDDLGIQPGLLGR